MAVNFIFWPIEIKSASAVEISLVGNLESARYLIFLLANTMAKMFPCHFVDLSP